ncbi:LysR family transcriptional regulator [Novosphingobium sp. 9]|uniref:LysR family transcriptional regulator n=1 Tax=Novosphingobium sp. 9 TaxID=2025349 RepID=UPI0021B64D66|nr:LysR substrate-binding domain-containing protein [Novosphingobium sp. 9]
MIELRQLRYFVELARTLHFGQAARALHISQPPLSRQIAALEADLGVRLVERNSRHARLTPAGEQFAADARRTLATFDEACRNARLAEAGEIGELAVGFMMHAAYGLVPALTRRYMTTHPLVRLHLRETVPQQLLVDVAQGRLDAGVTFDPGQLPGLSSATIHREPLVAAIPADDPLAAEPILTPAHFTDRALIAVLADVAPTLRRTVEDYVRLGGGEPEVRLEVQLQQTIVGLVAEGLGLALVPASVRKLGIAGVRFVDLEAAPEVAQAIVWREDSLNPALPGLLAMARA